MMRAMPKLDPNSHDFRAAGHRLIDWVADYLDNVDRHPVLARVRPGEIEAQLPAPTSSGGRSYDALLADFEPKPMASITKWNHPELLAYIAITGSQAGLLAGHP